MYSYVRVSQYVLSNACVYIGKRRHVHNVFLKNVNTYVYIHTIHIKRAQTSTSEKRKNKTGKCAVYLRIVEIELRLKRI